MDDFKIGTVENAVVKQGFIATFIRFYTLQVCLLIIFTFKQVGISF